MELLQLLTTLRRRWKFVVSVFLAGVLAALAVSLLMPARYESTVRVYLSASANDVFDQVQMGMYTSQRAKSYAALAEDTSVLEGVIERSKVDVTPEALADRVEIEVIPDTVVLHVAVRDGEPAVAQQLADAYAAEIAATVTKLERPATTGAGERPQSPIVARPQGKASVSSDPVSPNLPLNVAVGAILGLLFGVGGAVLRELLAEQRPADLPPEDPRTLRSRAPQVRRELVP